MTPLHQLIADEISQNGPMPLGRYMTLCLSHPTYGYYMTQDVIGSAGDFTTAPEISQIFGELIGIWFAQRWIEMGSPGSITLIELGPGRGTLMRDILRVAKQVPNFHGALKIVLVETSDKLRALQMETLSRESIMWEKELVDATEGPVFVIANEFFDALPARQYQKAGDFWTETRVNVDGNGEFVFDRAPATSFRPREHWTDGTVLERSPLAEAIVAQIAEMISRDNGAALIFDYGAANGSGDTFQAVQDHKTVSPLRYPGEADLTFHVNFSALMDQAEGKMQTFFTTQREFLRQMGAGERAKHLSDGKTAQEADRIYAGLHRLTDPHEMGQLFKVMALTNSELPPPGFAT